MNRTHRAARTTRLTTALPLALGAAALLSACSHEKARTSPATPVKVAAATPVETAHGHRYSANVQPRAQVTVAFRSSGYVESIARSGGHILQPGDAVSKGTLLAGVRQADTAARVGQAKASLVEAEAGAERSRLDLGRAEGLYASKSLTRPDLDGARAAARMADARVAAARAQLVAAELALEDTRLVAPLDAVVLARSIEEGTLVAPGAPGFVLADTGTVKAVFGVSDVVVETLRLGTPIAVSAQALPGVAFDGRVTAVSPSADPTSRVFDVEVTIPNRSGRLKAGMVAAVELRDPGAPAVQALPSVPLSAVLKSPKDGGYAVFVVETSGEKTAVRARPVRLGDIAANHVVVLEGLKSGENVVVTGASLLADGEAVRVIP